MSNQKKFIIVLIALLLIPVLGYSVYKMTNLTLEAAIPSAIEEEGSVDIIQTTTDEGIPVKNTESSSVQIFISEQHRIWNQLLGWGGWKNPNFSSFKAKLGNYDEDFEEFFSIVKDESIKTDIEHALILLDIAFESEDVTALLYTHRIFHDLDIAYNGYSYKGFGGYSAFSSSGASKVENYISNFQ
ncbi:hypothetical protein [Bacillus alkalicellulosilyticus]|uniref:hypothetical protein n=1 Tax=Alkalihalobacterium alkalicellulosilyticum TaxID=1912214 RepID=UPI000996B125|nr:hypothetical protein [Bacillus alkalicellulosilyticus]